MGYIKHLVVLDLLTESSAASLDTHNDFIYFDTYQTLYPTSRLALLDVGSFKSRWYVHIRSWSIPSLIHDFLKVIC